MSKNAWVVDVSGREHLEEWRTIPVFNGNYEASNLGRIRRGQRVLKQRLHYTRRYPVVELSANNRSRECLVHRLVLMAFCGEPPEGMEACHNNGNRTDNRLENLRWDTHSANSIDQVKHGTHRNIRKTECDYGHPMDDPIIRKNGTRLCRECKRLTDRAYYQANKDKWKMTPEQNERRNARRRKGSVDTQVA